MKRDYAKTGMSAKSSSKRAKYAKRSKPTVGQIVQREILKTAEYKESQNAAVSQASTITGSVVVLNFIAEGDDAINRQGRKITTRGVDIKYRYASANSQGTASAQVALVYDAQPDGSSPSYSTIFDTSACAAGIAFKNTLQFKERFKIFWCDELPESNGSDSTSGYTHRARHYISLKGDQLDAYGTSRYSSTAASVPNTGAWYLCYGDTVNTTVNASITYNCKYTYTDA